jgi:hypothetical protein
VLVAAGFALAAAPAFAVSPVIVDCRAHNRLTHQYTVAQLRSALSHLSATDIEYLDCYQVIGAQLATALARNTHVTAPGKASTGSGGSFLSAPLLIVLALIVLAGGGFALSAWRKRGGGAGGGGGGDDGGSPPPPPGTPDA